MGTITLVASEMALHELHLGNCTTLNSDYPYKKSANGIIRKTESELLEYFKGKRKNFDIPLEPQGSEFQKKAWKILQKIPYGETISYKEEALLMGSSHYARAVGQANGKNPIAIIIPCHRVIAATGGLGGYSGGLSIKRFLLALELQSTESATL